MAIKVSAFSLLSSERKNNRQEIIKFLLDGMEAYWNNRREARRKKNRQSKSSRPFMLITDSECAGNTVNRMAATNEIFSQELVEIDVLNFSRRRKIRTLLNAFIITLIACETPGAFPKN